MKKGYLICLEGIEGTGKTTQANLLYHHLLKKKYDVVMTREPGGTVFAESIRQLILYPSKNCEPLSKEAELLLLFAARAQHVQYFIKPALNAMQWVICDRFIEASYAYQGGGREISEHFITQLEEVVVGTVAIDCVLLLDIPVPIALKRMLKRDPSTNLDRIENEQAVFFRKVRAAYLKRAAQYPARYYIVDASQSIEQVHQQIIKQLETFNV